MQKFLIFSLFLVMSCKSTQEKKDSLYFDMEDKINSIIEQMEQRPHHYYKWASMNGIVDSTELELDSAGWARELELFSSANINHIKNRGVYEIFEDNDLKSNLKILRYTHKNPEEAQVPKMEIYYLNTPAECRSITIEYREANAGFFVHRKMEMAFEEIDGKEWLRTFNMDGYQKILGQDTVFFTLAGNVEYR